MGDLSYPIYLVHSPLGWLMLYLCAQSGLPITGPSVTTLLVFVGPVVVVSWLLSVLAERPIELIRTRVKSSL